MTGFMRWFAMVIPYYDDPFYVWFEWSLVFHDGGWFLCDERMVTRLEWKKRINRRRAAMEE